VLAEVWPYLCPAVARLAFHTRQAELLYALLPVIRVRFKSSPHILEPSSAGQSSEGGYGRACGSCGLYRGPIILLSRPLSPDAKLSLERGASNPAKPRIEQLKSPRFDRYGNCIFDAGQSLMSPDIDNLKVLVTVFIGPNSDGWAQNSVTQSSREYQHTQSDS
jgi:hypothetical protein